VSGRVINMYGPTETTVWSATHHVTDTSSGRSIPIGRPIANTQIYILDQNLQPVPAEVPGELVIGGEGVVRGYLNRPELTAERFIADPFKPGQRLYRTGDQARWRADGVLEFLGRLDNQVKIRGHRVELGEVEAVLERHPAVHQAVVVAREDTVGDKRLVGYVVPKEGRAPTANELREHLGRELPVFMVPALFVTLDAFPLTPNKKVDRKSLPAPDASRPELGRAFVAPRTPNEAVLAGFFQETLALSQVGIFDDFIELGGDSLSAVEIFLRIKQTFRVEFPLVMFFQVPTIAGLAQELERSIGMMPTKENAQVVPPQRPAPSGRVGPTAKEAVYEPEDSTGWRSVLPVQTSVFGSVEFASIAGKHLGYQARLYVFQDHDCLIAYPFFLRPIRPLALGEVADGPLVDTVSPEFTGPLVRGGPVGPIAADFQARFSRFAVDEGIVAEFIHLHPWKALTRALLEDGLQFSREIVYVDLAWPEQRLWGTSFTPACRNAIRRSRHEDVRIFEAQTMGDVREFYRVYIQTMQARNALKHYYFPFEYFSAIFEQLRANARFTLAEYRDRVIAGVLCLHDRDEVYYYLGGADSSFQRVRPTNAIMYDTILWAQRHGKKRLVLGAGYLPNDGVLRFKASFSPERAKFFVYKRVHLPDEYAALCRSWSSRYGRDPQASAYFPPYRVAPSPQFSEQSSAIPRRDAADDCLQREGIEGHGRAAVALMRDQT
jgi:acyl carrier protein